MSHARRHILLLSLAGLLAACGQNVTVPGATGTVNVPSRTTASQVLHQLSPDLERLLINDPGGQVEVLVTLSDQVSPPLQFLLPAGDVTFTQELAARLTQIRAAAFAPLEPTVRALGGQILQQFYITPTTSIRLPVQSLKALAALPNVVYVGPVHTNISPP